MLLKEILNKFTYSRKKNFIVKISAFSLNILSIIKLFISFFKFKKVKLFSAQIL